MRKIYLTLSVSILFIATSLILIPSCNQSREEKPEMFNEEEEEGEGYDGPEAAAALEFEKTANPYTGKIPWDKLRIAIEQTEARKVYTRNESIQALSWIERGPDGDITGPQGNSRPSGQQTSGRVRAVMVDSLDPTHKTVLIGSVAGGLWRTTDITTAPANWTLVNDYLSNLAVADLAQDPRPGFQNIIYMATGESYSNADAVRGVGVFKSTDDGATWSFLPSTSAFISGTRIVCDQLGNVYLGTRNSGLQRSSDGGLTWTNITPSGIGTNVCDLEISSTGRMHVTTGIMSTSGYRYTDNPSTVTAATWTSSTTPFTTFNQRTELAVSGNFLIAAPANAAYQVPSIWKSSDGGDTWVTTATQPSTTWASGQGWYAISAAINPANPNNFIVGGLDCWRTIDGGATWIHNTSWATSTTNFYVHADQHDIQWYDGGTKMIYACDGGIHFSPDGGISNTDRNKGLRIKQFYSVAIHPAEPNYFIAGAQDNGMHRLNHPGLDSSIETVGGDGCFAAIDQDQPQYQFGSYVYNVYRRSTNNGATWTTPVNNQSTGRFVNPWDYDDLGNRIYACNAGGNFRRWNDPQTGGNTEIITVPEFGTGNVSAVHVSPYTPNTVYFGLGTASSIVRVDNAHTGTTINGTVITPAGATGYVNSIVTGASDQHLIATYSSYGVTNVWVSTNGGTSWTAVDGNLPDMPVRWALFHPDSDTKAFIATETGVWETDLLNGAATVWNANPSFPNVRTDMIKYRAADRTIAAGTHGRGIWSAVVPPPSGFTFNTPAAASANCPAPSTMDITLSTISAGGFVNPITLTASGAPAGTSVSFLPSNVVTPGNNVTVRLTGANTLSPGTYTITVTGTATGTSAQTVNLNYVVNPGAGPGITGQPADQTVCAGNNASFTVTSAGATSFRWEVSTDGGNTWSTVSNGGVYSGATTNTLTITNATNALNGNRYRAVAMVTCGSTTSTSALLTVNVSPAITAQPQSVTTCAGSNHTFNVTATGSGITYQWQLSAGGCAGPWVNITGATSSSYTVNNVTTAQNNTGYRVVINGICNPSVTSNCASLTVVSPVTITSQPADQTVCEGGTASFSVTGTGTGISYQWQISTDGGSSWTNVVNAAPYSGAGTSTLSISPLTVSLTNTRYRVQLSNTVCSNPVVSNSALLTVNTLPVITVQPVNATICAGGSNSFVAAATGTGISYQWQVSTDGGVTWTNITGANAASYTVSAATASMNNYRYRVVVSGACSPAATSTAAVLTVITPVAITSQPASMQTCAGGDASFSVTATSTQTISYQWQVSTDGGTTWTNISGATLSSYSLAGVIDLMNNNRYRVLLSTSTCSTPVASSAATLTVRRLPTVGLSAGPLTSLLPGQTTTLTATPSGTGGTLTTSWYREGTALTNTGNTYQVNVNQLGSYQVKIQEAWPGGLTCFNESPVVVISANVSSKLFIFPTPNDGRFTVSYYNSAGTGTSRTVTVYDAKGAKVYHAKFAIAGPYTLMDIDLRPAQQGVYFVVVGDVNGRKLADGKVLVHL